MNYHRSRSLEKIRQTRSRLLRTHAAEPASSVGRVVALYAFQEGSARIQFPASCLLPSAFNCISNTKVALSYKFERCIGMLPSWLQCESLAVFSA